MGTGETKRDKEKKENRHTQRHEKRYRDKQIERDIHSYKHTFLTNPSTWPVCSSWERIVDSAQQGAAE